jgi:hypothetical protein
MKEIRDYSQLEVGKSYIWLIYEPDTGVFAHGYLLEVLPGSVPSKNNFCLNMKFMIGNRMQVSESFYLNYQYRFSNRYEFLKFLELK